MARKAKRPDADPRCVRAISLPIRCIVGEDGEEDPKVLDAFRDAWRLSTDMANWCQRELMRHEIRRSPSCEKLGKYDPKMFGGLALYSHVNAECPFRDSFDGAAGSLSAITKAVEDAWRSHPRFGRFAVLWKGESSAAAFRFPYPWPMRAQELKVGIGLVEKGKIVPNGKGRPLARLTLPGKALIVRLGDGPDFHRQLSSLRKLIEDPKRIRGSKVTARRKAGKLVGAELRLVGSFDAVESRQGVAAVVRTDPNALLVAEVEGRRPWILNCDHIVRQQAAHRVFLQRIAEDLKHEKRLTRSQRAGINEAREKRCFKHASRMDTAIHQHSAQLVGYLLRTGVATAVYDDANKEYIPDGFPWAKLAERVAYKLAGCGVEFIRAEQPATIGGK